MNSVAPELVETTTNQPAFDWSAPVTIDDKEEPADCLDRAKYAEFLTNYLSGFTDKSYVMNLNAEWGAGKTYFLKRWQETIKDTYPTAYIDAWKHDFDNEPLLTVISGITKTLEEACPNVGASQKQEAVYKSGKYLLSSVTDAVSVSGFGVNFDLGKAKSTFSQKRSDNELKVRLRLHNKKIDQIKEFRDKLQEWLEEVISYGKLKIPMFVFIDELDRCRPTYAIDMLEVIKHLFDIEGLVFVVATNTDQLQHSIKSVYGEGFDASFYLNKFFRRTYTLKNPDLLRYIKNNYIYENKLSIKLRSTCDGYLIVDDVFTILVSIGKAMNFDLRTTDLWLEQIYACYQINKNTQNQSIWFITAFLLAAYLKSGCNYKNTKSDILGFERIKTPESFRPYIEKNIGIFSDIDCFSDNFKFEFKINPNFLSGSYIDNQDLPVEYQCNKYISMKININDLLKIFRNMEIPEKTELARTAALSKNKDSRRLASNKYTLETIIYYCYSMYGTDEDFYWDLVQFSTDLH